MVAWLPTARIYTGKWQMEGVLWLAGGWSTDCGLWCMSGSDRRPCGGPLVAPIRSSVTVCVAPPGCWRLFLFSLCFSPLFLLVLSCVFTHVCTQIIDTCVKTWGQHCDLYCILSLTKKGAILNDWQLCFYLNLLLFFFLQFSFNK